MKLLTFVPKKFQSLVCYDLTFTWTAGSELFFVDIQASAKEPTLTVVGNSLAEAHTKEWLKCYFHAETLPQLAYNLNVTTFQQRVLQEISTISCAETISYQALAEKVGAPLAYRAVARACGKNPLPLVIPCHRVINKNNKLGGYNKGLLIKEKLLQLEKSLIN